MTALARLSNSELGSCTGVNSLLRMNRQDAKDAKKTISFVLRASLATWRFNIWSLRQRALQRLQVRGVSLFLERVRYVARPRRRRAPGPAEARRFERVFFVLQQCQQFVEPLLGVLVAQVVRVGQSFKQFVGGLSLLGGQFDRQRLLRQLVELR